MDYDKRKMEKQKGDELMCLRFALVFEGVTFFKAKERNNYFAFTEDTCTEYWVCINRYGE